MIVALGAQHSGGWIALAILIAVVLVSVGSLYASPDKRMRRRRMKERRQEYLDRRDAAREAAEESLRKYRLEGRPPWHRMGE